MDPNLVYEKTPAGEEAVHERARLAQRSLRTVLIVIDGRSSVDELCGKVGDRETVESALEQLERDGFVQAVSKAGADAGEAEPAEPVDESSSAREESKPSAAAAVAAPSAAEPSPFLVPHGAGSTRNFSGTNGRRVIERIRAGMLRLLSAGRDRISYRRPATRAPARRDDRKSPGLAGWVGVGVALAILLAVVGVLAFPYGSYRGSVEATLSAAFRQPVSIAVLRGALSPAPALVMEDVRIGANSEVKIREIRAAPGFGTLLGLQKSYRGIDVDGPSLPVEWLPDLLEAGATLVSRAGVSFDRMAVSHASVVIRDLTIADLSGELTPATGDRGATLVLENSSKTLRIGFHPAAEAVAVHIEGSDLKAGERPAFELKRVAIDGQLRNSSFAADKIEGQLLNGVLNGQLTVDWGSAVTIRGRFSVGHASGKNLSTALGAGIAFDGDLDLRLQANARSDRFSILFENANLDGDIVASRGSVNGFDLAESVRRSSGGTVRGGATRFERLSGRMVWNGSVLRLSAIDLQSGPLRASGNLTVGKGTQITGLLDVMFRNGGTDIRQQVTVTGSTDNIQLLTRRR